MPIPSTPLALDPPEGGHFIEIQEGIYWVRMPLPLKLNHVNLWLMVDEWGWTIIDTGYHYPLNIDYWQQILSEIIKSAPIKRVICTHYHPDHAGNAGWLVEQTGADFWMSEAEWLASKLLLTTPVSIIGEKMAEFATLTGMDDDEITKMRAMGSHYQDSVVPLPMRYHRLIDRMWLTINQTEWQVIVGFGHAMEHISLYAPSLGILIAGDQVLPEITPNISTHWFNGWSDPLGGFLNTTHRLKEEVADDTIVLPSHRQPFKGLHHRLDELITHHEQRLAETREFLAQCPEQTGQAADIMREMFKMELDSFGKMFAIGEAEAHLRHLITRGEAELLGDPRDQNRPWRYRLLN